jgi:hypothetical protein
MPTSPASLVVFFAWQSEVFKFANRRAIEASLRAAASRVEDNYADRELTVHIDKDTSNRAGSPAIADTILEKIEASDVFLGDVTITNSEYAPPDRHSPNANVLLEQGFAAAHLGWDRIISVFNMACGQPPTLLPFDLRHRRISQYTLSDDVSKKAKNKADGALTDLFVAALTEIIEKNPARPAELKGLSEEEIKERRDIENLTWLLHYVHWPTLEEYIEAGPKIRSYTIVDLFESFEAVLDSSLFHLYDSELGGKVVALREAWDQALSHAENYEPTPHGRRYVFTTPPNRPLSEGEEQDWEIITAGLIKLRPAMDGLLQEIRARYTSIDIAALSEAARQRYVERQKAIE